MQDTFTKSNNQLSFEGKGEVITEFHKLSEELSSDVLSKLKTKVAEVLKERLPLFKENPELKINSGDLSFSSVKKMAEQFGLVDTSGNITGIDPKSVIIRNGNNEIPDTFVADRILQRGGQIDGVLKGKEVWVSSGSNGGVEASSLYKQYGKFKPEIKGETNVANLKAHNASLDNKITVTERAELKGNSKVHGELDTKTMIMKDNSSLNEGSNVKVSELADLRNDSKVHGELNAKGLKMYKDSSLEKGSKVTVKVYANLEGNSKVHGELDSKVLDMYGNSSLGEGSNVTVPGGAYMANNSKVHGELNTKTLYMDDNSSLEKDSKVRVSGLVDLRLNSKVHGELKAKNLEMYDDSSLKTSSNVTVSENADIYEESTLSGKFSGKFDRIDSKVRILPSADLDKTAYRSLPLGRRVKYRAQRPMGDIFKPNSGLRV